MRTSTSFIHKKGARIKDIAELLNKVLPMDERFSRIGNSELYTTMTRDKITIRGNLTTLIYIKLKELLNLEEKEVKDGHQ